MEISISTSKNKQVLDITTTVEDEITKSGWKNGAVHLFVMHTTCSLTTMDLDPGTDLDALDAIEKIFPKGEYRHPHDPGHVGDHVMSSIIGSSVLIPVNGGKLILGEWQRIVLIELAGPRERNLYLSFLE